MTSCSNNLLTVYNQVFADDVIADLDDDRTNELRAMAEHFGIEYVPDEPEAIRLALALTAPGLEEGDVGTWFAPYKVAGFDSWLGLVRRLRVASDSDYVRVYLPSLGSLWFEQLGQFERVRLEVRGTTDRLPGEAPRCPLYTLELGVDLDAVRQLNDAMALPERVAYVRPWDPDASTKERAVARLATALRQRIRTLPNGEARLRAEPVRAPLCALAATVWSAMGDERCRVGRGWRFKTSTFEACLDAFDLGGHHETARRILLRDHPEHIHVDVSDVGERHAAVEWEGRLGVYARDDSAHLRLVRRATQHDYEPRVLYSLSGPDPL